MDEENALLNHTEFLLKKIDSKEYSTCLTRPAVTEVELHNFRERLGLSIEEFSLTYGISMETVEAWEGSFFSHREKLTTIPD